MKIGLQLHPDRGVDAVIDEARRADEQGYDSIWLSDHLFGLGGPDRQQGPDGPLDYFVLATALGVVTTRTKLAWGSLNLSFRPMPLFAKMLTSLDHITKGRLICTFGSGWFKEEYEAYNVPWVDDHDDRIEQGGEIIRLMKELWTHPAPERVTFEGKYVQVHDVPFNPAPYQKPRPPIWLGGESEATLNVVKQDCDGWMTLSAGGNPELLKQVLGAPDWPRDREMTVCKGGRIVVAETHDAAIDQARADYDAAMKITPQYLPKTFEEFEAREIIGTPDECLDKIAEVESWGVNYLRLVFQSDAMQESVGRLIIPRLAELPQPAAAS